MTNPGIYGYPKATGDAVKPVVYNYIDLTWTAYGLSKVGSPYVRNYNAVMNAFANVTNPKHPDFGKPIHVPAGRFPTNGTKLPPGPVHWFGESKDTTVFLVPQGQDYALTYDNTAHIPSSSPWYTNATNGANSNHAWRVEHMAFEGPDWGGSAAAHPALYFPAWAATGRDALALRLNDVGVYLFNSDGIQYEISGLWGDSVFEDVDVAACAGNGVIPGSDQRWINLLTHDCASWGVNPSDHRNTQFVGGKAYGNTSGGYRIVGDLTLLSNLYAQDNHGPGFSLDGCTLVSAGQLVADRNCTAAVGSGMVLNNVKGVIVDGYLATDTQRTQQMHAIKVTGTNSNSVVTVSQIQTNSALGSVVESNSGGVTVNVI